MLEILSIVHPGLIKEKYPRPKPGHVMTTSRLTGSLHLTVLYPPIPIEGYFRRTSVKGKVLGLQRHVQEDVSLG